MSESNTFEKSISRLDEIVKKLEKGDAPLDKALSLFEEGTGLIKTCNGLLENARLKVTQLVKGSEGEPVEKPFDGEER